MPEFFTHPVTLLAVGGGAGANARYWVGRLVAPLHAPDGFPWATFLVNTSGSVVLGFVVAACLNHPDRRAWSLLLGAGFCGGFTTFSTFSLEAVALLQNGRPGVAAAYVLGSVAAGLLGLWAALRAGGGP